MTNFVKVLREQPLASGSHAADSGQACVMEKVAILWALGTGQDVAAVFSDLPACTNEVVAKTAQGINDRLGHDDRQRLNVLIPRLLRCRRTDNDQRINVRLAIWAARRVLHLVPEKDRQVCGEAIEAAEAWLADPTAAYAAAAYAAATYAAYAAHAATYAAAAYAAATYAAYAAYAAATYAAAAAYAAHAAYAAAAYAAAAYAANADALVSFLDELLDAWEEVASKEGEDIYVPQQWEDEALAYLAELG